MATGRIGVTPNLRTRWSKAPAGGTTSLSGLDDNSVSLVYDAGFEAVYRNGVLLSRGNDYTATNGTTITLIDATIAGDIIEVFANQAIPLTSTYTQAVADGKFINNTLVDAKGDIIAATAADTPARLAVGSNDQVLTADSSTSTGLKWATPSSGGMTLLSTTTLSGTTTTVSGISQSYTNLMVVVYQVNINTGTSNFRVAPNGTTNIVSMKRDNQGSGRDSLTNDYLILNTAGSVVTNGNTNNGWVFTINNYTSAFYKPISGSGTYIDTGVSANPWPNHFGGAINTTSAITSLVFSNSGGYTFAGGTVLVYGVK